MHWHTGQHYHPLSIMTSFPRIHSWSWIFLHVVLFINTFTHQSDGDYLSVASDFRDLAYIYIFWIDLYIERDPIVAKMLKITIIIEHVSTISDEFEALLVLPPMELEYSQSWSSDNILQIFQKKLFVVKKMYPSKTFIRSVSTKIKKHILIFL